MKKLFIALLGLFLLSGCFQSRVNVFIKKDGSGNFKQKVLISSALAQGQKSSIVPTKEEFTAKAATMGSGVTYVRSNPVQEGDMEGYEVEYAFTDINNFTLDMGMGAQSKDQKYSFNYTKGKENTLVINLPPDPKDDVAPADSSQTDSEEMSDEDFEMMKMMYAGLRMTFDITVDGTITKTDAHYIDKNVVTLTDINIDEILKDDAAAKKILADSAKLKPAELKEFVKDKPGIKNEELEKVTVTFN